MLASVMALYLGCTAPRPEVESEQYGYAETRPILVAGLGAGSGPRNQRAYLDRLRGPNGEKVSYERLGSCCPFDSPNAIPGLRGMLDRYEVAYPGLSEPVVLYLNMYDAEEVAAPRGFQLAE